MSGAGSSYRPLKEIVRRRPVRAALAELLVPSEWWLRLHYGAGSFLTIRWYRWVGHRRVSRGGSCDALAAGFRGGSGGPDRAVPLAIIADSGVCTDILALAT